MSCVCVCVTVCVCTVLTSKRARDLADNYLNLILGLILCKKICRSIVRLWPALSSPSAIDQSY